MVHWGQKDYQGSQVCDVPSGLSNVIEIAAGDGHNLALSTTSPFEPTATSSPGATTTWGSVMCRQCDERCGVDAGDYHSLALRADGTVVAWGWNADGQCDVPLDLPKAVAVSAGGFGSMALVDPTQSGAPPTILAEPRSQTVAIGSTAHFSVATIGSGFLTFQWYFEETPIPGATARVLSIPSAQTSQSGAYTVVVSNGAGDSRSVPAMLSVLPGLTVTMVPAISLAGTVGVPYRIEYVNAVGPVGDWQELATVTVTNIGQFYFDVSAIGQPLRFYRLVELP